MAKTFNKTAIVTGGSRGIGAAIAGRLARDGFNIVLNYAVSEKSAHDLVSGINHSGGSAVAVQADVADVDAVKRLFSIAKDKFNTVDILVNNAGIMKLSSLAESDDALFDRQIQINLKGAFNTMREAAAHLSDGGRVINLSSSVVGLTPETYGVYASSKTAVETMTKIFAKELRGRSITANAVAPGPTATVLFLDGKSQQAIDRLAKTSPLERLATPEDIASVVSFLASTDGSWINGQIVRANGGMV